MTESTTPRTLPDQLRERAADLRDWTSPPMGGTCHLLERAADALSESVSTEAAWMEKVAVARNERDAAVRALKGLCAWHDHPSLTGYPYGTAIPAPVPSFNAVVDAVHAVIGQPPYKPEDMPEDD